ncbi:DUF3300 domain-containing protein [Rhodanobacter sp. L36]|uniref:DUF3300 domain-containing protein n=1 Tax=Rhodanobacter sp. L36 TaxID=1747221 RepID=UPI00131B222A|nr:DUF3300 domain-containing protein [Rhodanobacter sp. L36]
MITRRFLSVALNTAICAGAAALIGCNQQPASPQASASAGASTAPAIAPAASASTAQAPAYAPPTADQLYQLVAPIALFPDKLVAQVLAGSTYPDQVSAADTFLEQNQKLQGPELQDAVDPQSWDPSIKGLTVFPKVLDQMAQNIPWTTALGNAYANDPTDVLNAIQVMRQRASKHGSLRSSAQLHVVNQPSAPVDTSVAYAPSDDGYQTVYSGPSVVPAPEQTIEILPADQDTVYVPEYDPQTVYGEEVESYPDYRYEQPGYSTGDMVATGALAFGAGIAVASLFNHSHHHDHDRDRSNYGWNSWDMRWRGNRDGGGNGDRGHWQRPAVVHDNTVYVSKSTTIDRRGDNNHRAGNHNGFGAPGQPPQNAGAIRPPMPMPNEPGNHLAGPAHVHMPSQQPMNRPNFNGALTKGQPARFAHPGTLPGNPPGVRPGVAPMPNGRPSEIAHQPHLNMPGVSAPGAGRGLAAHGQDLHVPVPNGPVPHAPVAGQAAPGQPHMQGGRNGSMRIPGQHIGVAAPSRLAPTMPTRAPVEHLPQRVAPVMQQPITSPRPQAPMMHRDIPHTSPMQQRTPMPERRETPRPMPMPQQQREAPRPMPMQQREAPRQAPMQQQREVPRPQMMRPQQTERPQQAPRPQPQAHGNPPTRNEGHQKKDDKQH